MLVVVPAAAQRPGEIGRPAIAYCYGMKAVCMCLLCLLVVVVVVVGLPGEGQAFEIPYVSPCSRERCVLL